MADRFRHKAGERPNVDTQWPDVRIYAHLTSDMATLYIDTSGEPLFKRGWREDKGEAPLKETLAAAMIAASGWDAAVPLYDPCCGSGTIAIEAAQVACNIAPGLLRRFGFEKLLPYQQHVWQPIWEEAKAAQRPATAPVFGSDVAFRMVDFAVRNAERAGVARCGATARRRCPAAHAAHRRARRHAGQPALRRAHRTAGVAESVRGRRGGRGQGGRERAETAEGGDFFTLLAAHWKKNYPGWTAWVLTPDLKLPSRMRLKESRRVPMWNGPIECRLFRFDMVKGSARKSAAPADADSRWRADSELGAAACRAAAADAGAGHQHRAGPVRFRRREVAAAEGPLAGRRPGLAGHPADARRAGACAGLFAHRGLAGPCCRWLRPKCWPASIATPAWSMCAARAAVTCADPDDQMFIDLAVRHQCMLLSKDAAVLTLKNKLAALRVEVSAVISPQFS